MILGVPTLCRYDLLDLLILSAESGSVKPSSYIIIDNGGGYSVERVHSLIGGAARAGARGENREVNVLRVCVGRNLGVAASWNVIVDLAGDEPVLISNDDIVLAEETFASFAKAIARVPFVVSRGQGMALFAIRRECIEGVGYFDEQFYPAYYEDIDYHRRVGLSGIANTDALAAKSHGAASTRRALEHVGGAAHIHEGLLLNREYYSRKWGGPQGRERFKTPFNGRPPEGWSERRVEAA